MARAQDRTKVRSMADWQQRGRDDLLAIYQAALAAADPQAAVERSLQRHQQALVIGTNPYDLGALLGVQLLAAGKAAAAMARGAAEALGDVIAGGIIVTSRGSAAGGAPADLEVIEAGHPVPDQSSVRGGQELLAAARRAGEGGQLALVLLSGGASALAEVPAAGLTLADMQATTELLLRSGADISEINIVRKHLSAIKGGQLARAAAPAPMATLVLSDVVGSELSSIGSGPTVADPSTWEDVRRVIENYRLRERIPPAASARIEGGLSGSIADTPKPGDEVIARGYVHIVGDAKRAAEAARGEAAKLGWRATVIDAQVSGDAEELARKLPALIEEARREGPHACLVLAGETTVVVRGKGRGGRSQQLALAFALSCEGDGRVLLAALATDGIDGPTDAAGAIVGGGTAARIREAGIDPAGALAQNDAYAALDAAAALVKPGPTGTNVNDLLLILVE